MGWRGENSRENRNSRLRGHRGAGVRQRVGARCRAGGGGGAIGGYRRANRAFLDKNIDLALHGGDRIAPKQADARTRRDPIALELIDARPRRDPIAPTRPGASPEGDPIVSRSRQALPRGDRIVLEVPDVLRTPGQTRLERLRTEHCSPFGGFDRLRAIDPPRLDIRRHGFAFPCRR